MSLAQRSVTSVAWNIVANLIQVIVLFARSVLLARLLPVEVFGIYALAGSVVALTAPLPGFGMSGAFLHRAPETQDEEKAAAVHFTLRLIFTSIWAILLVAGAFIFTSGQDRLALLALTMINGLSQLAHTPRLILIRRVAHRRLALIQLLNAVLGTAIALGLAWNGVTLWALLSTNLVTLLVTLSVIYSWRPVWRPRLAWSTSIVRYYLSFGSRMVTADMISVALDRGDDLWTGIFLGKTPLSYYSRAYRFATYPRSILAEPINKVVIGTYAELAADRKRLSQTFFRSNALLVRSGFLLAGLLALIAPEFIRILLGAKWLPMIDAFRLMLIFTMLDPLKVTVGGLFSAVGQPGRVLRARAIQLGVLVLGLFLLGPRFGIAGVAVAVDLMLIVGIAMLLSQARIYVDISLRQLFVVPAVALTIGVALAAAASTLPLVAGSDWRTAIAKAAVFLPVYSTMLLIAERQQLIQMWELLISYFRASWPEGAVPPSPEKHP
jgi:O-antigen/teichoic acid export membrane protein